MKTYKITVNGRTYEVAVEESNGSIGTAPVATVLSASAQTPSVSAPAAVPAPVATPTPEPVPTIVASAQEAKPAPAPKGTVMKAPMPGTILSVKVKVGDPVKKGTVLCILEAMKMENEIQSGQDGVVTGVNVQTGQSVNAGDPMLSIG